MQVGVIIYKLWIKNLKCKPGGDCSSAEERNEQRVFIIFNVVSNIASKGIENILHCFQLTLVLIMQHVWKLKQNTNLETERIMRLILKIAIHLSYFLFSQKTIVRYMCSLYFATPQKQ